MFQTTNQVWFMDLWTLDLGLALGAMTTAGSMAGFLTASLSIAASAWEICNGGTLEIASQQGSSEYPQQVWPSPKPNNG